MNTASNSATNITPVCKVCGTEKTLEWGMRKKLWCLPCGKKERAKERAQQYFRLELERIIESPPLVDLILTSREAFNKGDKFKQAQIMAAAKTMGLSWRQLGFIYGVSHEKARYLGKAVNRLPEEMATEIFHQKQT